VPWVQVLAPNKRDGAEYRPEAPASASGKSKFAAEIAADVVKRSAPERRVTVTGTASGMRFHESHRQKRGFTQSHLAYWKLRLRGPTGPRIHDSRRGKADDAWPFRHLEVMQTNSPLSTRKEISARHKRKRTRHVVAASVALIGLFVGAGSLVQSAMANGSNSATTTELSVRTGLKNEQLHADSTLARAQAVQADKVAETTISDANVVITAVRDKVDATQLTQSVVSLADYKLLDTGTVVSLTGQTMTAEATAQAAAAEVDRAAAAAAALTATAANTPDGARATARAMAASKYGWGDAQFSCLARLWTKESGWSYTAYNPSGGATGIPQALPGSKMASAGADWKTNATTQISWGLGYISRSYGTPCSAWSHSQSANWY